MYPSYMTPLAAIASVSRSEYVLPVDVDNEGRECILIFLEVMVVGSAGRAGYMEFPFPKTEGS
jgi:hypothetical protein